MKLKFYMRGLGIGIVVTALTMGIATKDGRPLTDAEIRAAAVKLGMVDSSSMKLTDLPQGGTTESPKPDQGEESGDNQEKEPGDDQDGEEDQPHSGEQDGDESENEEDESDPEGEESDPMTSPTPTPIPEESSDVEKVKFTIKSGTGSRTVCNQLAEAGLIEDAAAFDQYLIDSGYSKRISAGTFEIPVGASDEEVAKIISRSR